METNKEVWFEIQYSGQGADDWFSNGETYDKIESAQREMAELKQRRELQNFEYRIVRKTLVEEVAA